MCKRQHEAQRNFPGASGTDKNNGMRQGDKAGRGWILLNSVRSLHLYLQSMGKLSQVLDREII